MTETEIQNAINTCDVTAREIMETNHKGKFPRGCYNSDPDGWFWSETLENIFSHPDVLFFVSDSGDILEVISYLDEENTMYYPSDRFIKTFADTTPDQAVNLLDTEDETLW